MTTELDPTLRILTEYLAGNLVLDAAVRELLPLVDAGVNFWFGESDLSPKEAEAIAALVVRMQEIEADERLRDKRVTAVDILTWDAPADPLCFAQSVEVRVEASNATQRLSASFRAYVCTPAWLAERAAEFDGVWGRGWLVMPRLDAERRRERTARPPQTQRARMPVRDGLLARRPC